MFQRMKNLIEVDIFDSAPCPSVHFEIGNWLKLVEKTIMIKINKRIRRVPKQVRGSNECGVHVLGNAVRFKLPEERTKCVSLHYLRKHLEELVKKRDTKLRDSIIREMKGIECIKGREEIEGGSVRDARVMMRDPVTEEEDDSDADNEDEDIDVEAVLKDYPRTGESYRLEPISCLEMRAELSKMETRRNKSWQGVARGTENRHRVMLDKCVKWVGKRDPEREGIAMDTYLISCFLKEKVQKNWTYGTLLNYLASVSAALRLLPLYRQGSPSIYTGERFRAAVKNAKMEANREGAKTIVPEMTEKHLKEVYNAMGSDEGKTVITLAWDLAGRVSDILKLRGKERKGNNILI
eukprot:Tbor_TRINITY_DN6191_c0_g1::TRINITY_DN6191_c0_g1_i5::g.22342::m.22342